MLEQTRQNPVEISEEILARFIGGDIEIQSPGQGAIYRGPIKGISVEPGRSIIVEPERLAVTGSARMRWEEELELEPIEIDISAAMSIGFVPPGLEHIEAGDRLVIYAHPAINEIYTLYPKGGSKLDLDQKIGPRK